VTAEAWQRIQEVFDRVLAAPPSDRSVVLAEACGGDDALRAEVESLLEFERRAGDDFLASPAVAFRPADDNSPDWAQALVGRKIGRYTLVRLIASGGMGCVFEARQDRPARAVALKILRPGFSAPSALARFRLEPEVLGRLQHPNIAQVFEAGVHEDEQGAVPYFAMEFITKAQPLIEYADAQGLTTRQRLELFAKVCDAVQHGHQKGIIHRDLKPANILVGQDGEPKVIDFGVARASDADIMMTTQYTHVGDLVGTVHYMSPEQCDADPAAIDTRTDIYSLGVVLYELLTGAAPYDTSGTTVYAAVRAIKDEPPRPPSAVIGWDGRPARQLRGDIDAILLKTLEKDPARRYASMADLAQDIRRHLAGEPIEARPPTLAVKVVQWAARHPRLVTTAACGLMLVIAAAASFVTFWYTTMRPHRVVISDNGDVAELQTAVGAPLERWAAKGTDQIRYGALIPAPAAPSGGPLVIIGYAASTLSTPRSCYALCDLDRDPKRAYLELRLADTDVPQKLIDRQANPDSPTFRGDDFGAQVAILADVFPDPDGSTADELVGVFQHMGVTHAAICVYRLDGTLLYRVWVDATIMGLYWMANPRLLVCAGVNGEATLGERLGEIPPEGGSPHPLVVFAIKPERDWVTRDYVVQEPALRAGAPEPLRPVWYYCVHPLSQHNLLGLERGKALVAPYLGYGSDDAVTFNVKVRPALGHMSDPTTEGAGRGWIISGAAGDVRDYPIGDSYRLNERSPTKPDNPLPPWESWYLGELPAKRTDLR